MTKAPVAVTDHAVVRFLERVMGMDLSPVRELIRHEAEIGVRYSASGVRLQGIRYILQDGSVVTVVCHKPKSQEELDRRMEDVR